jgi:ribonuclease E
MKRILVNATQQEELRVAMVDGQRLYDLDIETASREQKKGNIYKGRITRVERALEAAFVDYGASRHGFLPLKEVARSYFRKSVEGGARIDIREVLQEGQEVVVQVEKEERGNKGAALTTFISLAGRFLVLMPNNPRAGGVSRRIDADDRAEMREILSNLEVPDGMGLIVRTAGVGRSQEELDWDLRYLLSLWHSIEEAVDGRAASFLVYQDSNLMIRALRDHFNADIGEILIDGPAVYEEAMRFVEQVMPHQGRRLKLYDDEVPLFTRFQIESQIESAFAHAVTLPSGGSIVIDPTEALVSIDINSARATKGDDIEATALNTNLEAADEIARQLRLRDIGGLIVIDFIDMGPSRNQREVETRLRDAVKMDRARVQIGRISRFGLLEMSRQRLRPSLEESSNITCPRCNGQGVIRDVESLSLAVLRLIGEEARKEKTAQVVAQLPVEVGTYLLNEKRDWIGNIETSNDVRVVVVPSPTLETPNYSLRRVREDEVELPENTAASYRMAPAPAEEEPKVSSAPPPQIEAPAVKAVVPTSPAPTPAEESSATPPSGALTRLMGWVGTLLGGSVDGNGDAAGDEASKARAGAPSDKKSSGSRGPAARRSSDGESGSQSRSRGGQRKRGRRSGSSTRRSEGESAIDKREEGAREARSSHSRRRNDRDSAAPTVGASGDGTGASQSARESRPDSRGGRRSPRRASPDASTASDTHAEEAAQQQLDMTVPAEDQSAGERGAAGPSEGETTTTERSSGSRRRGRRGGRRRRRSAATSEADGSPATADEGTANAEAAGSSDAGGQQDTGGGTASADTAAPAEGSGSPAAASDAEPRPSVESDGSAESSRPPRRRRSRRSAIVEESTPHSAAPAEAGDTSPDSPAQHPAAQGSASGERVEGDPAADGGSGDAPSRASEPASAKGPVAQADTFSTAMAMASGKDGEKRPAGAGREAAATPAGAASSPADVTTAAGKAQADDRAADTSATGPDNAADGDGKPAPRPRRARSRTSKESTSEKPDAAAAGDRSADNGAGTTTTADGGANATENTDSSRERPPRRRRTRSRSAATTTDAPSEEPVNSSDAATSPASSDAPKVPPAASAGGGND